MMFDERVGNIVCLIVSRTNASWCILKLSVSMKVSMLELVLGMVFAFRSICVAVGNLESSAFGSWY